MVLLEERQTRGYQPASLPPALAKRIIFLAPADRKMVELASSGTLTHRDIALLMGLSHGTICRRLKRLINRLNSKLITDLIEQGDLLPEFYKEVGLAYFLTEMTYAEIMAHFHLSIHQVRRITTYLRGWNQGPRRHR